MRGHQAFAEVSSSYDTTNVGYLLERLLIHMDDFNASVQDAVCKVEPLSNTHCAHFEIVITAFCGPLGIQMN
jgi:hypothetical protein